MLVVWRFLGKKGTVLGMNSEHSERKGCCFCFIFLFFRSFFVMSFPLYLVAVVGKGCDVRRGRQFFERVDLSRKRVKNYFHFFPWWHHCSETGWAILELWAKGNSVVFKKHISVNYCFLYVYLQVYFSGCALKRINF